MVLVLFAILTTCVHSWCACSYQEKFYFSPGDTGFKVWDTKYGRLGAAICWDQWFPETARSMALMGAEVGACGKCFLVWRFWHVCAMHAHACL
jgi:predicted amidohydrolase